MKEILTLYVTGVSVLLQGEEGGRSLMVEAFCR